MILLDSKTFKFIVTVQSIITGIHVELGTCSTTAWPPCSVIASAQGASCSDSRLSIQPHACTEFTFTFEVKTWLLAPGIGRTNSQHLEFVFWALEI